MIKRLVFIWLFILSSYTLAVDNLPNKPSNDPPKKYTLLKQDGNLRKVLQESFQHYDSGVKLLNNNEAGEAKEEFEKAIEIDSSYPEPFFYLGNIYLNEKNVERAEDYFNKAYNIEPKRAEILYSLGLCFYYRKNLEKSLSFLAEAVQLSPKDGNIQHLLKTVDAERNMTAGMKLMKNEDYDGAFKSFSKAINILVDLPESYHLRAQTLIHLNKFSLASEDIEKALAKGYKTASVFFDAGYINYQLNEYQKAQVYFEKAISLDSLNWESFFYLGNIYINKGEFSNAVKYFESALDIEPTNTKIFYQIGLCHYYKKDQKKALSYLNKALELNPSDEDVQKLIKTIKEDVSAYVEEAKKLMDSGEYKKALSFLSDTLKLFPDASGLYHMRGQTLIHLEKFSMAVESLEKALEMDSYNSFILSDLGYAYYQLGEYAKAAGKFEKAVEINPDNKQAIQFLKEVSEGDSLFKNGVVHFNAQEYEKALESFSRYILTSTDDYRGYHFRGLVFIRLGEMEKALEDFQKALSLQKNNARILFNIGYTYYKMMDYPNALEYFKKSKILNPNDTETEAFLRKVQDKLIEEGYIPKAE